MRSSMNVVLLIIVIVATFPVSCYAISGANLETRTQHESRGTTMTDNRFLRAIPVEDEERGIDFSKLIPKNWFRPKVLNADAVVNPFSKGTLKSMVENEKFKADMFMKWDRKTIEEIELSISNKNLNDERFKPIFAGYVQNHIAQRHADDLDYLFKPSMLKLMTGNAQMKNTVFKMWDRFTMDQLFLLMIHVNRNDKRFKPIFAGYVQNRIAQGYVDDLDDLFKPGMLWEIIGNVQLRKIVFNRWDKMTIDPLILKMGNENLNHEYFKPMFVGYVQNRVALEYSDDLMDLFKPRMLELMTGNALLKNTVFEKWDRFTMKQIEVNIGIGNKNLNNKSFERMFASYARNRIAQRRADDFFKPKMLRNMLMSEELKKNFFNRWDGITIDQLILKMGNENLNNKHFKPMFVGYVQNRIAQGYLYDLDEFFKPRMLELMTSNAQLKNTVFKKWDRFTMKQIEVNIGIGNKNQRFKTMFVGYVQNRVAQGYSHDLKDLFKPRMLELMTGNAQLKNTVFKKWDRFTTEQIKVNIGIGHKNLSDEAANLINNYVKKRRVLNEAR